MGAEGENLPLGGAVQGARGFSNLERMRWKPARSGDIFELRYGKALVAGDRGEGPVPVFGTNGQCGWHDRALFTGPGVVIGRKGQGPLGVEWVATDHWIIDTAYSLRLLRDDIDLKFSYYLIKYVGLNHLKDGTSNPTLSRDSFGAQYFPIPPIEDQKNITKFLSALDDKIDLNRQINQTLEAMAQSLFQSWFVDFDPVKAKVAARQEGRDPLRAAMTAISGKDNADLDALPAEDYERLAASAALFPDEMQESELGEIPGGWERLTAQDVSDVAIGKTPPRKEPQWFSEGEGDWRWVSIRDMGTSGLYVQNSSEYLTAEAVSRFNIRVVPDQTVILSFKMTIGRVAITDGPMVTNEAIAHFVLAPGVGLSSEYL